MNAASVVILAVVVATAALAVWRVLKKGMPCECGGSCCDGGAGCRCKDKRNLIQ